MKIHSNLITASHIHTAADYAGLRGVYGHVFVENLEQRGSRTRLRAWNFHLRGDGSVFRRRPNTGKRGGDGEDYAATWCQWGDFLASLYAVDPDMHCAYYANANDFHRRTAGAFAGSTMGPCEMQACSACRGTISIPYEVRWAAVPQPTRNIPEGATAHPARPRIHRQRRPAPTQHAEPTQRDIVAEIERTIDAYERERPGCLAEKSAPYGSQLGELADDPCGYRFVDDTAPKSLDEVLDDPLLDDGDCDGSCIERPHRYTYGSRGQFRSPVCQRSGCNVMGTGDRCGDGECEGRD